MLLLNSVGVFPLPTLGGRWCPRVGGGQRDGPKTKRVTRTRESRSRHKRVRVSRLSSSSLLRASSPSTSIFSTFPNMSDSVRDQGNEPSSRTWRHTAQSALTRLSHGSAPFITTFVLIHLTAPVMANLGGTSLSSQVMVSASHGCPRTVVRSETRCSATSEAVYPGSLLHLHVVLSELIRAG